MSAAIYYFTFFWSWGDFFLSMLYQLDDGSGSYRSDTRLYRKLDQTCFLVRRFLFYRVVYSGLVP